MIPSSYFSECKSTQEIKSLYCELAKKFHPDLGGDNEIMKDINIAYAFYLDRFSRLERPGKDQTFYDDLDQANELIRSIVSQLLNIRNIEVEICGFWVWVSGDTKPNKDYFKSLGLRWAPNKQKWYFPGVSSSSRGSFSMDEIRSRYGSKIFTKDREKEIS